MLKSGLHLNGEEGVTGSAFTAIYMNACDVKDTFKVNADPER